MRIAPAVVGLTPLANFALLAQCHGEVQVEIDEPSVMRLQHARATTVFEATSVFHASKSNLSGRRADETFSESEMLSGELLVRNLARRMHREIPH